MQFLFKSLRLKFQRYWFECWWLFVAAHWLDDVALFVVQGDVLLHILIRVYSPNLLPKLFVYFLAKGRNVNDIDLNAGGLSEAIVANQTFAVGPTFGYKLMEQFADSKKGDRFYYENAPSASILVSILKSTIS